MMFGSSATGSSLPIFAMAFDVMPASRRSVVLLIFLSIISFQSLLYE